MEVHRKARQTLVYQVRLADIVLIARYPRAAGRAAEHPAADGKQMDCAVRG